jgi:hypothetical protein
MITLANGNTVCQFITGYMTTSAIPAAPPYPGIPSAYAEQGLIVLSPRGGVVARRVLDTSSVTYLGDKPFFPGFNFTGEYVLDMDAASDGTFFAIMGQEGGGIIGVRQFDGGLGVVGGFSAGEASSISCAVKDLVLANYLGSNYSFNVYKRNGTAGPWQDIADGGGLSKRPNLPLS